MRVGLFKASSSYGNRTHDSAVRGQRLSLLTNEPHLLLHSIKVLKQILCLSRNMSCAVQVLFYRMNRIYASTNYSYFFAVITFTTIQITTINHIFHMAAVSYISPGYIPLYRIHAEFTQNPHKTYAEFMHNPYKTYAASAQEFSGELSGIGKL